MRLFIKQYETINRLHIRTHSTIPFFFTKPDITQVLLYLVISICSRHIYGLRVGGYDINQHFNMIDNLRRVTYTVIVLLIVDR